MHISCSAAVVHASQPKLPNKIQKEKQTTTESEDVETQKVCDSVALILSFSESSFFVTEREKSGGRTTVRHGGLHLICLLQKSLT